jgi:hypothetical protein
MAVTLTNIESQVRYLIGDNSTSSDPDVFTYSTSSVFTLTEDNPISVSTVTVNDVDIGDSNWSFSATTNKVTITSSLSSGDTVEITYTYYPNYSSTEVQNYIRAALIHISANNYKDFKVEDSTIYPEPETREENLIAAITALLIEPDNKSYRLPDVSVSVPKDLPTHEKIRRTITVFKKNVHGLFDVIS